MSVDSGPSKSLAECGPKSTETPAILFTLCVP